MWCGVGAAALSLLACGGGAGQGARCGAAGSICTIAGTGEAGWNGDGLAPENTSFYWPMDVELSPAGALVVLDWNNHRVRQLPSGGVFQTLIGTDFAGDGPPMQEDRTAAGARGTDVELNHPTDVTFLPDGTLLLAAWHNHKVRRWDPATGMVHVVCGSDPGSTGDGGLATRARLSQPKSVTPGPGGVLYVTDSRSQRIRALDGVTLEARITPVAGSGLVGFDGDGGPPLAAKFHMQEVNDNPEPGGSLAVDGRGRIYLADTFNHRIRLIDLEAQTVSTVAGNGGIGFSGDGGSALGASLNHPRDLELGPDGKLYIADTDNHRVRAVDLQTGVISTVAGSGVQGFGGDGGAATAARLDRPFGIGFDADGNLLVADTRNNRIRKVVLK